MLAGDPAMADPVCAKSPDRPKVDALVERAQRARDAPEPVMHPLVFRDPKESRRLAAAATATP